MNENYYSILGVSSNASDGEIRDRFRALARTRHPDRSTGSDKAQAELEFQKITEAFNVLIDHERRRQHDFQLARPDTGRPDTSGEAAMVYMKRGVEAFKAKRFVEAADCFAQATEADPEDPKAWYALGRAASQVPSRLPQALKAAEKAVALEPMNVGYLKLAGTLAAQAGMKARAERHLVQAIDWGGDDEKVQALLKEVRKKGKRGFLGRET